jgi:lipoate-protein ligase A
MLNLCHTKNFFILEQLKLEESILRGDLEDSFCIINEGSKKAVVVGSFGDKSSLCLKKRKKIPIIKRFSGGGTVIVDENTIFITFIFSKELLKFSFPEEILKWSENLYKKVFNLKIFALKENDYVLSNFKCAGNALHIRKNRFLLHTSFLWDYEKENMEYLKIPKKTPKYRNNRDHLEFLCKLKNYFPSKEFFIEKFKKVLKREFSIKNIPLKEALKIKKRKHIKTTTLL